MKPNKLAVHFSSAKQDWATPQDFFDKMSAKYGSFDLDVCADASNAKCTVYCGLDNGKDGLAAQWRHWISLDTYQPARCWMNPPYGRGIGAWIKKAYEESLNGCLVVALLPARTDTR